MKGSVDDNQTGKAAGKGEHPLGGLTLLSQQRPHDNHAAFPSVMLIKRQQVPQTNQKTYPAEDCAVGSHRNQQVEDDSAQMHEQLLRCCPLSQRRAVESQKRTQRKDSQIE